MIFKQKDVTANINYKDADIGNIGANFYTEDESTASIRINLRMNEQVININTINMKPRLDLFCEDGSIFMNEPLDIILPEQGIIRYTISKKVVKHSGKVNAKLFLVSDNEKVHVANFKFNIVDSGVEEAVAKEVDVDLVDGVVKKIMTENAMGLLDDNFKEKVNNDLISYVASNPDIYQGKSFTYKDFTQEDLDELRRFIVPGETETRMVNKDKIDSLVVIPPNKNDIRVYPKTVDTVYFNTASAKYMTPENSMNADGSFIMGVGGWLFYTVNAVNELKPGSKFSVKINTSSIDSNLLLQYAIQDNIGNYIQSITPLNKINDNEYGIENIIIPANASTISLRIDARQTLVASEIKNFYLFVGGFSKQIEVTTNEKVINGILKEIDLLKQGEDNSLSNKYNLIVYTPREYSIKANPMNNKIVTNGKGEFDTLINMNDYKVIGGKGYYLDSLNGNDSNNGLTKESAFKTFKVAMLNL